MSDPRPRRYSPSSRKRSRPGFWATVAIPAVVLAIVFVLLAIQFAGDDDPSASLPISTVPPIDLVLSVNGTVAAPGSAFEFAEPRFAIDGDTLEVVIQDSVQRVRLYGIDAPERGEACYNEASARLQQLLNESNSVLLHPGPRNDDGNRLLRYAFTEEAQVSIDALLIREGLAEAWRRDGQLRDELVTLEDATRAQGQGCLWARSSG